MCNNASIHWGHRQATTSTTWQPFLSLISQVIPQCSHLLSEQTYVGGVLTDNAWKRAAGIWWSTHFKEHKHVCCIFGTNCCMSHFGIQVCGVYNSTCVVEGVAATTAPGESTGWEPQSHTRGAKPCWREAVIFSRAAPVETGLPLHRPGPGKEKGALGGFGWEWWPTLHLDAVNAVNGSTAFSISPEGKEWRWGTGWYLFSKQTCTLFQQIITWISWSQF